MYSFEFGGGPGVHELDNEGESWHCSQGTANNKQQITFTKNKQQTKNNKQKTKNIKQQTTNNKQKTTNNKQ